MRHISLSPFGFTLGLNSNGSRLVLSVAKSLVQFDDQKTLRLANNYKLELFWNVSGMYNSADIGTREIVDEEIKRSEGLIGPVCLKQQEIE